MRRSGGSREEIGNGKGRKGRQAGIGDRGGTKYIHACMDLCKLCTVWPA